VVELAAARTRQSPRMFSDDRRGGAPGWPSAASSSPRWNRRFSTINAPQQGQHNTDRDPYVAEPQEPDEHGQRQRDQHTATGDFVAAVRPAIAGLDDTGGPSDRGAIPTAPLAVIRAGRYMTS